MAEVLAKLLVLFLCVLKENFVACARLNCYQALADCNTDGICGNKLKKYTRECETIVDVDSFYTYSTMTNTTMYPCSKSCIKSIKSLRKTDKGNALWSCDCLLDARCIALKTRTEKCLAIANGTYRKTVGCSYAYYKCMKDPTCKAAQMDFLTKCAKIFTLTACTNHCLCSQKRLFSLAIGQPLLDCECDGSDELYCLGLRAHADYMKCSWKKRSNRKRLRKRCRRCKQRKSKGDKCGKRDRSKKRDRV